MRIGVLGGGPAGLASALVLARDGHDVTLIERDDVAPTPTWEDMFAARRRGIAHFQQPHGFLPRGANEMREHFPDVYQTLRDAGAGLLNYARKVPGGPPESGPALEALTVRRPVIEWALRKAVADSHNITVVSGVRVDGIIIDGSVPPRISAVRTSGGVIEADLFVDALGRTSQMSEWIAKESGGRATPVAQESSSCESAFFSRYYEVREGCELPDGPWLLSPRGDLGYAGFTTFPGDNRTFAVAFLIHQSDNELKALRGDDAFDAATRLIPTLAMWTNPELVRPITSSLTMGNVHNTLRRYVVDDEPVVRGVVPVADAYCHTNPMFALGMSLSLIHPVALRDAIRTAAADVEAAYFHATYPELRERFDVAVAFDDARTRSWMGEKLDFTRRAGCLPLFLFVVPGIVGMVDQEIGRAWARRTGFVAPLSELSTNEVLLDRMESKLAELMQVMTPPPMPSRDQLIAAISPDSA